MTTMLVGLGEWLLTYLLHSTIAFAAIWLLASKLRQRPDVGDRAWKLALVAGLVTASAQMIIARAPMAGVVNAPLEPVAKVAEAADEPAPAVAEPPAVAAAPNAMPMRAKTSAASDGEIVLGAVAESTSSQVEAPSPSAGVLFFESGPAAGAMPTWMMALVLTWLIGAALFSGLLALAWIRLRLILRARVPLRGRAAEILDNVAWRAGLRKPIRLSTCEGLDVPIAFGILSPEITIPLRAARELSDTQLEGLLAHECAHLVRRDSRLASLGLCDSCRVVDPAAQPSLMATTRNVFRTVCRRLGRATHRSTTRLGSLFDGGRRLAKAADGVDRSGDGSTRFGARGPRSPPGYRS